MLGGIWGSITKKVSEFVSGAAQKLKPAPIHFGPLNGINFDKATLCPPDLDDNQIEDWVKAYLQEFKQNALLLWADENNYLKVVHMQDGHEQIYTFPEFMVDPLSHEIKNQEGTQIKFLSDVEKVLAQGEEFPHNIFIPTKEDLKDLKFTVQFKLKFISSELIQDQELKSQRSIEAAEANAECIICTDEYTDAHPPYMLLKTGNVYHKNCLKQHFESQKARGIHLVDPLNNAVIQGPNAAINMDKLTKPATSYKNAVGDSSGVAASLKNARETIKILFDENQALKAQLQAQRPIPADPIAASNSHESSLEESRGSNKAPKRVKYK